MSFAKRQVFVLINSLDFVNITFTIPAIFIISESNPSKMVRKQFSYSLLSTFLKLFLLFRIF